MAICGGQARVIKSSELPIKLAVYTLRGMSSSCGEQYCKKRVLGSLNYTTAGGVVMMEMAFGCFTLAVFLITMGSTDV